ncbi:hypothetical protein [Flaviaesturariibacter aridisoli]|uniref:Uncharacterized protein n=1 Tax=Flaviaesturariibacter aridisoli TaxID=2545761 RepID=A0A4R4E9I6_9BACT|nr:hypothetical protein [Flaviaesturariibacter aridisoli]TCZ74761.1 hypothetical protein E0486_00205 [Flaviaesturariibacter aridisoli]
MNPFERTPLSPYVQLQELEDAYAECLIEEDVRLLGQLWKEIRELRTQLSLPIYDFVTPAEQRM